MDVRNHIRSHVWVWTAAVSVVSLVLVFAAALGVVPETLLPAVDPLLTAIPHLNAILSLAAIATIMLGVGAIRNGAVDRHRLAMVTSAVLFGLFLALYLYRVSLEGPTTFGGPETVKQYVYLPILAIHILLAIVCLPFVYAALLLAGTHSVRELPNTPHARVGRVAAILWLITFSLGIVVYLLLYGIY